MIKRRRTAVLAAFAVAASVFLLPASPASAVTFDNACVNSLIPTQSSLIPITMTADASPNPVPAKGSVTLSNIQQHAAIPPAVFVAGYNAGVLATGTNNIPVTHIHTKIAGDEHGRGHPDHQRRGRDGDNDDHRSRRNPGDRRWTATPGSLDVTYDNETWTAGARGAIKFREKTMAPPR